MRRGWARVACALVAALSACATGSTLSPQDAALAQRQPQTPSPAQQRYYRQAFPDADRFRVRRIPKSLIRSLNKGNTTYVVAQNAAGEVLGYLRDINAPVSVAADCPCAPLSLTLAFEADKTLATIIAPSPLRKKDRVRMDAADIKRLVELARNPPAALTQVEYVEQMVDARTGATKKALREVVVPKAAYTTHRVVGLVQDTRRILKQAPQRADKALLTRILDSDAAAKRKARALARAFDRLQLVQTRQHAYRALAQLYIQALQSGAEASSAVERILLAPDLPDTLLPRELAAACYALAKAERRIELVGQCQTKLSAQAPAAVAPALLARLQGAVAYARGRMAPATQALRTASQSISVREDPSLYAHLAQSAVRSGQTQTGCRAAKTLFRAHPLYPGAQNALGACPGRVSAVVAELRQQQKQALLAEQLGGGPPAPPLQVENARMQPHELDLTRGKQVTVLAFFATWCPHCQAEMPRLVAFHNAVQKAPKLRDKVRTVGIRTAVERETRPYSEFVAEYDPSFPIWTDAAMSVAFSKFAATMKIPKALPTLVVLDADGVVQFYMETGAYKDTKRELLWAVRHVLANHGT